MLSTRWWRSANRRRIAAFSPTRPSGSAASARRTNGPHLLRRVVAVRADTGDILVFLTNHHQLGASTVAAIYKERWQIELLLEVQQRYETVDESMVLLADPTVIQDIDKRAPRPRATRHCGMRYPSGEQPTHTGSAASWF